LIRPALLRAAHLSQLRARACVEKATGSFLSALPVATGFVGLAAPRPAAGRPRRAAAVVRVAFPGPTVTAANLIGRAACELIFVEAAALGAIRIWTLRSMHASAGRIAAVRRADIVVDAIDRCMATPHGRVAGVRRACVVVVAVQRSVHAISPDAIIPCAGIIVRALRPPAIIT